LQATKINYIFAAVFAKPVYMNRIDKTIIGE